MKKCQNCGQYVTRTRSIENLTKDRHMEYECLNCGHIWSEDQNGKEVKDEHTSRETG